MHLAAAAIAFSMQKATLNSGNGGGRLLVVCARLFELRSFSSRPHTPPPPSAAAILARAHFGPHAWKLRVSITRRRRHDYGGGKKSDGNRAHNATRGNTNLHSSTRTYSLVDEHAPYARYSRRGNDAHKSVNDGESHSTRAAHRPGGMNGGGGGGGFSVCVRALDDCGRVLCVISGWTRLTRC